MAIDPRDPLESIDVSSTRPSRTEIARVKRQLFNIGEDYEDPRVQFKYYRNMAARYGSGFVIARRQSGNLWSWGCSAEEPTYELLDIEGGTSTATYGQLYIGQSFTPDDNWIIDQIYVNYAWVTGGATHCKVTIRQDSGGDPGSIVATADLLAISDTAAPGGEYTFTFSTPPQLTSGNTYWVVFQASDSGGNPSGFFFWYYWAADVYAGGNITYSTDGATWNPSLTYEIRKMKILGRIPLSGYPQFGLGSTSPTSIPQMIDVGGVEFSRVFAPGRRHTIALDTSGAPYAWGDNEYGQITVGPSGVEESLLQAWTGEVDIRKDTNSCAFGQTFTPSNNFIGLQVAFFIRRIGSPTGNMWVELRDTSGGSPNTILATSQTREVSGMSTSLTYQWFDFDFGDFEVNSGTKYAITLMGDFSLSSTNYFRGAIVGPDPYASHAVFSCFGDCTCDTPAEWSAVGTNDANFQIIGMEILPNQSSPIAVTGNILGRGAAAGWGHSLVIDQDDTKLWGWGLNDFGQVGDGTTDNKASPVQVVLGSGRRFRKIDAGDFHTVTLDQRGKLWAWGKNENGQLGNARGEDLYTPASVAETTYPLLSFDFRDSIVSNNNDWVGHQTGFTIHPYRYGSGAFSAGWFSGFFDYVDGYTPTSWSEPAVLSVEYKLFNMAGSDIHKTSSLTKGQAIENCVPFLAGIKHGSTGSTDFDRHFCRISLDGTNTVRCSTGPNTGVALDVGVYIVEFNPQRVKVQSGRFDISTQSYTVTLDEPVNTKKAFIHIQWRSENTNTQWRDAMVRARITDPETIVIDRYDQSGDMDIRWWVVESLNDAFDVETVEWQHLQAGHGDHYGSLYQSPVVGNNTNFNRALTLVTCKNNQSGNTVDIQPCAYFDDSTGTFYSKANNNPSIPGRVVDYVGQVITFNDASKNLNGGANGFLQGIDFGEFPRNVTAANLLTQDDGMYFPGRYSGSETMYPNTEYGMVYCTNPQGMCGAIGYSSETHYLDSSQFLLTYTDGTVTVTRGDGGGGRCFWSAFEFDSFNETSENSGRTAKPKTRTFGALDGSTAMNGSYVPFPDLSANLNVGVSVEGVNIPVTGSSPFTIKTIIKTPAVSLGASSGQLIFSFAGSYDIYGVPAYGTCCRFFYADNRAGSQKGRISIDHGSGMTTPQLDNFFEPETWYTLHYTYDGGTTTKLFINNELVLTTTLAGVLSITGGGLHFFSTGFSNNKIFTGVIDYYAIYARDFSEDEILGEGEEQKFIEIAAGSQSSYGIDVNGIVYSWGDNTYGQLGDGTTTNKSAPVSVVGRHSFIQVTGGGAVSEGHACGLKPDGSVWCWGRNHRGQLGLCDYTDRSTPTLVIGNHSFIDVWAAKDGYNTIAIKLDGSVWVWGKSPFCDGVDYCSPVSIPDFNLIALNILGRGYFQNHSNLLRFS